MPCFDHNHLWCTQCFHFSQSRPSSMERAWSCCTYLWVRNLPPQSLILIVSKAYEEIGLTIINIDKLVPPQAGHPYNIQTNCRFLIGVLPIIKLDLRTPEMIRWANACTQGLQRTYHGLLLRCQLSYASYSCYLGSNYIIFKALHLKKVGRVSRD